MTPGWWWGTTEWECYEIACGLPVGSRRRELAGATWQTRVVDLDPYDGTHAKLWSGIRKSYKSIIHGVERKVAISEVGRDGPAEIAMERCRLLHAEQAGRETRPKESWDLMAFWVRNGYLRLYCADGIQVEGGPTNGAAAPGSADGSSPSPSTISLVAFAAVYEFEGHAYLGHMASRAPNVNTALCWRAMLGAKGRGIRTFETGWQGQATDEKGRNIEYWRRGMGGVDWPADPAKWPVVTEA